MKKTALGLSMILTLIFSAAAGLTLVDSAKADPIPPQYVPIISINSDGSVAPETGLISRDGNVYALTGDVNEYQITIQRSNIVLDGAGYTLRITNGSNDGVHLSFVTNVTIKNIEIIASYTAIHMLYCSHCYITGLKTSKYIQLSSSDYNTVTESTGQICLLGDAWESIQPNSNLFSRNNITGIVFRAVQATVEANVFYKNNMLLEGDSDDIYISPFLISKHNFWDNGSVGNYWSDYNGVDANGDGIGDTSYLIYYRNVDRFPLMAPFDIESVTLNC